MTMTVEKPTVESRKRRRPPWAQGKEHPVPWSARTYCMDFRTGRIKFLTEQWDPVRGEGGVIITYAKRKGTLENKGKYPVMTFAQADAVQRAAEAEDIPLKVAFAKVIGVDKLSPYDFERLATAPEIFPVLNIVREENVAEQRKEAMDRFQAFLNAKPPEAPKKAKA